MGQGEGGGFSDSLAPELEQRDFRIDRNGQSERAK